MAKLYIRESLEMNPRSEKEITGCTNLDSVVKLVGVVDQPFIVTRNGRPVLRNMWSMTYISDDDIVFVILLVRGSSVVRTIAQVAIAVAAIAVTVITGNPTLGLAVLSAGSLLLNVLIPPARPPGLARAVDASPTYNLSAQGNQARLGGVIPVPYGRNQIFADFSSQPHAEYASNSQYLFQTHVVGKGEYDIEQIRIGQSDVDNFPGVTSQIVPPGERVDEIRSLLSRTAPTTFTRTEPLSLTNSQQTVIIQDDSDILKQADYIVATWTTAKVDSSSLEYLASFEIYAEELNSSGVVIGAKELIQKKTTTEEFASGSLAQTVYLPDDGFWRLSFVLGADNTNATVDLTGFTSLDVHPFAEFVYTAEELDGGGVDMNNINDTAGPYPACPPLREVDRISFDLVFENGVFHGEGVSGGNIEVQSITNASSGSALVITVRVEARQIDGRGFPLTPSFTNVHESTYSSEGSGPQRRTIIVDMPSSARWEVKLTRVAGSAANNIIDFNRMKWAGLRGYVADDEARGDVTRVALRLEATGKLSAQATRRISVVCTRKLQSYLLINGSVIPNPELIATKSIAWAAADLLLNEDYGGGFEIDEICIEDLIALDNIWTFRGDNFNYIFDTEVLMERALQDILRAGRARHTIQLGVYRFIRDSYRDTPSAMFSIHNISINSFGVKYVLPRDDTPNVAKLQFVNEDLWTLDSVESNPQNLASNDQQVANVSINGITNKQQAQREIHYHLRSSNQRRVFIDFETELEGNIVVVGSTALISHAVPSWGLSSFLTAYDADNLTFKVKDAPALSSTGTNVVYFRRADNSVSKMLTVTQQGEVDYKINELPLNSSGGTFDPILQGEGPEPTHVIFGVADNTPQDMIVLAVEPSGSRVRIKGVLDDLSVYLTDIVTTPGPESFSAEWTDLGEGTTYTFQYDDDINFGSPVEVSTSENSTTESNLGAGVTYYMKVRATLSDGTEIPFSPVASVTTITQVSSSDFAATGGNVTTSGEYTIHTFPVGTHNFTVTAGFAIVEVLMVAGGGDAGGGNLAGGGGAGGLVYYGGETPRTPHGTAFTVTAGESREVIVGTRGQNSSFERFIGYPIFTYAGGDAGFGVSLPENVGENGGSGGGGGAGFGASGGVRLFTQDGFGGGRGIGQRAGGGGGGANGAGQNSQQAPSNFYSLGGDGGPGAAYSISGSAITYAAGGGARGTEGNGTGGGAANTGSGGHQNGLGQDGTVIIRYLTPVP